MFTYIYGGVVNTVHYIYIQDNLNTNINVLIFGGKINEVHLTFQWKLVRCIFSLKVFVGTFSQNLIFYVAKFVCVFVDKSQHLEDFQLLLTEQTDVDPSSQILLLGKLI